MSFFTMVVLSFINFGLEEVKGNNLIKPAAVYMADGEEDGHSTG